MLYCFIARKTAVYTVYTKTVLWNQLYKKAAYCMKDHFADKTKTKTKRLDFA